MPESADVVDVFTERLSVALTSPDRLAAVASTGLLDSISEPAFDRIASLTRHVLKAPFGFITIVDDRRSFWKASSGLPADAGRGTAVEESFCQYVIGTDGSFLVDDAREHMLTRHNPSVDSMNVQAWAGAPLRNAAGLVLGTICVVDTAPRTWSEDDEQVLELLAGIVLDEIASRSLGAMASRSETILNAVLERAPIGFAMVDDAMRFEMINTKLAEMNGRSADEHLGRSIQTMLPDVADSIVPVLRRVIATGEPAIGLEASGRTHAEHGRMRHWLANYYRLDVGDGVARAGMFLEDVTGRVQMRHRAEGLAEATAGLAVADTPEAIGRVIATHSTASFGADFATFGLVDRMTGAVTLLGSPDAVRALAGNISIDDDAPYAEAVRSGRSVFIGSANELDQRFPRHTLSDLDIEASACVPCKTSTGAVIGVIMVVWTRPVHTGDMPRAQLRTFGDIVSQAFERTQNAAERDGLISTLQRDLLRSSTANHERLDVAVHYEPVNKAIGFGGDWYDVIAIDDHRTALVVGDVTGHDADAAAHMTRIRTTLATLIGVDTDLGTLFAETERLLRIDAQSAMASAAVVIIDHEAHTATTVCAGHPPPILMTIGEPATRIAHGLGPWIGAGCSALPTPSVHLAPGSTLALYTDGVVERRGFDIDSDIDRLVAFLDGTALDNDDCESRTTQMVRLLTSEFLGKELRTDDVALVVACIRPADD